MAQNLNSCSAVALRLQTYLDGELDEQRMSQIRKHLDACIDCGYEADTFREIKKDLSSLSPEPDAAVIERLKDFTARIAEQASED